MMSDNRTDDAELSGGGSLVPPDRDPALMMQQARAAVVSNVLQKGAIGLGVGLALSFGLFKRRTAPILFSTGFAFGMAFEQGNESMRDYKEKMRQNAIEAVRARKPVDFLEIISEKKKK